MIDYIFSVVFLAITLGAIELRKSYRAIPKTELRYRARHGDALAEKIYSAVSYEDSLEALLWLIIIVCVAVSFILFSSVAPPWFAFIAIVVFLWLAFAWLPKIQVTSFSNKVAMYLTPSLVWVLNYLHPLFKKANKVILKSKIQTHTGIYDPNELAALLDKQKSQADNRVSLGQLELIQNILSLSQKTVGEYCRNWSKIKHVKASETVGPILLDELHKSGQQFIPVVDDELKQVVGIIDLNRLDISTTGEIKDLMDISVHYLNEDDTLEDALAAITESSCPVYIVRDKKERLFGIITLKDVMKNLTSGSQAPEKSK